MKAISVEVGSAGIVFGLCCFEERKVWSYEEMRGSICLQT